MKNPLKLAAVIFAKNIGFGIRRVLSGFIVQLMRYQNNKNFSKKGFTFIVPTT
jgi:hypothetical protein